VTRRASRLTARLFAHGFPPRGRQATRRPRQAGLLLCLAALPSIPRKARPAKVDSHRRTRGGRALEKSSAPAAPTSPGGRTSTTPCQRNGTHRRLATVRPPCLVCGWLCGRSAFRQGRNAETDSAEPSPTLPTPAAGAARIPPAHPFDGSTDGTAPSRPPNAHSTKTLHR
jgi:hypothetical protein